MTLSLQEYEYELQQETGTLQEYFENVYLRVSNLGGKRSTTPLIHRWSVFAPRDLDPALLSIGLSAGSSTAPDTPYVR
jgi:hypothetical protein